MKCIVTGGEGFIGHWLCIELEKRGHAVISLDNNIRGGRASTEFGGSIVAEDIDLAVYDDVLSLLEKHQDVDVIFHLAAFNGTQNFYNRPFDVVEHCTLPIINICKALGKLLLTPRILYTSSSEVYARGVTMGISSVPTGEDVEIVLGRPDEIRWSYGSGKAHGEYALAAAHKQFGLDYVVARVHNIYGPRMGFNHFIPDVIRRFRSGDYHLPGAEETRSFCYILDAVDALISLISVDKEYLNDCYHVGSNNEVKIKDVAKNIMKLMNIDSNKLILEPSWPGSVTRRSPDIGKVMKTLPNWSMHVSLEDGLEKMVNWYSDGQIKIEKEFK